MFVHRRVLTGVFGSAIGLALLCACALAETFPFRHYQVRDGLVQDQAFCAYQDPHGYIWFGTFGGLSRYDGQAFRNYSLRDGLPSSSIHTVFQDRQGRVWVGTPNGAALLKGDRFVQQNFRSFQVQPPAYAIRQAADGRLLFATSQGLLEWQEGRERLFTEKDGLLAKACLSLATAPDGTVYVGTQEGLHRIRSGRIEALPQLNREEKDEVRSIQVNAENGTLLLTRRNRLTLLRPTGESSDLLPDPAGETILWDAAADRQGTLWVTSVNGLFVRFPGREFIRLTTASGLLSDWCYLILIDYEDNVWICSNGGVDKLADRSLILYTAAGGLAADTVWSVTPIGEGILVGTDQGGQMLGPQGLDKEVILPGRNIVEACPRPDGELLVATDKGLHRCRGGRATPASTDKELMGSNINRILPLADGGFLLGTSEGLFHARLPQAQRIPLPDRVNKRNVYDILPRGGDAWWLATERGVFTLHRRGGAWSVDSSPQMNDIEVQCFAAGPRGELFIGTIGFGVFRWDGLRFAPMAARLPNQSDNIWCLKFDPEGVLWLGTSHGLVFVKDGEAHDFNAIHGLPSREVTSRASIHFDGRGDCYFGTTGGLIRFRPVVGQTVTPPRLEITGLAVDQKRLDRWAPPMRLRHDETLAVTFKCLSFVNEEGNRYQFRLEGVDPGWSELTADDHVFYPYLPPGEITFRLRAFNSQGVPSADSPALRLVVVPPFTRTVWFYLLVGLAVFAVAGSFLGYKLHLDRREKIKLRELVSAKTAALQTSEEKYRELVEGSLIGIAILQEGRLVFANSQIPRTFKYPPEEILGQLVEKFVLAEDLPLLRARLAERLQGDVTPHEFEIRVLASDQAPRTLLVHTNVTQFDGRSAILLNFIDITDKKKLQEQIIHYQKLESIGTLAGGIAHDFNNILQGITGYSSLIRMQLPPESPLHRDLGMIEEASGKAAILTKKLLGFARKGKYLVVHFNIHEVIESVIALSRRTIPLNIEFVCRFASRPLSMLGDRSQMEQVFLNLFLNSRDAIGGSGEIRIETELYEADTDRDMGDHILKAGSYIRVVVADTGGGIPAEVLPRIFDPFFTTKPQGKGSGLGLATVYGIVKNHHGYIYIRSEPRRGTRVELYLPHSVSPEGMPAPARDTLPFVLAAARGMKGKTVLVVDDEAVNRRFMNDLFRQAGLTVLEADNGQRAVEVFRAARAEIALVVLDINMPVMPGQHALEQLLALRPDLPILVLSGYQEDAIVQEMIRRGARDFVQKPVDAATLLAKIAGLLEGAPKPAGD